MQNYEGEMDDNTNSHGCRNPHGEGQGGEQTGGDGVEKKTKKKQPCNKKSRKLIFGRTIKGPNNKSAVAAAPAPIGPSEVAPAAALEDTTVTVSEVKREEELAAKDVEIAKLREMLAANERKLAAREKDVAHWDTSTSHPRAPGTVPWHPKTKIREDKATINWCRRRVDTVGCTADNYYSLLSFGIPCCRCEVDGRQLVMPIRRKKQI